jgi:dynein heavy chain
MLSDIKFLPDLFDFSAYDKDNINDETCEFLEAYIQLENFNSGLAKKASGVAEGLCKWVIAIMSSYHAASTIVKSKMNFLKLQTAKRDVTLKELAGAEAELNAPRRKMEQANNLINGLAGEKARWTEDSKNFADRRNKLVGDVPSRLTAAPSTASSAIAWLLNVGLKITPSAADNIGEYWQRYCQLSVHTSRQRNHLQL